MDAIHTTPLGHVTCRYNHAMNRKRREEAAAYLPLPNMPPAALLPGAEEFSPDPVCDGRAAFWEQTTRLPGIAAARAPFAAYIALPASEQW